MNNQNNCQNRREAITAFVLGQLESQTADELKKHIDTCETCQSFYQALIDEERTIRSTFQAITDRSESLQDSLVELFARHEPLVSRTDKGTIKTIKIIGKAIMKSPITKLAAAAIVTLAALVGIKMFGDSAKEPSGQKIKQEDPYETVEGQRVVETLHAELNEVRQMAAVGDVKGLAEMLSEAHFESKLVAANFLAKIGRMPALETLSMYASGDLILDSVSGNIRLRSTKSQDWLEVIAGTLRVHADQDVNGADQVRLTYDIEGDDERWEKRQRGFANMRQERADLERELAELGERPPGNVAELRKRLAKYNKILDHIDGAVYVSIENGRMKLNCPTYHRIALAELHDGTIRVEWHGHIVEADSVTLLHGLAPVRTDGPPLPTPGWRSRFDKVYSLNDGEVLRWVRTPFIPERQIYATQELRYYQSTDNPPPPGYLSFRWDGRARNWTLAMTEGSLALVLHDIGLKRYEYRDESGKLLNLKLGGDWILRDNISIEDKLLALEKILQKELGRMIKFEKRKVNCDVIIVRGQYKHVPQEGAKYPNKIDVPFGGGSNRNLTELFEKLGSYFNRPIVFETKHLSDIKVSYYVSSVSFSHRLAKANAKTSEEIQEILDSVLENLSRQTSLQFEYGQREQVVWFITEKAKR